MKRFLITNSEKGTENSGNGISSSENGNETQNEENKNRNSNQLNSNNLSDSLDQNPWPNLHRYYKFARNKSKSLEFLCLLCKPKNKQISVNQRSLCNYKQPVVNLNNLH